MFKKRIYMNAPEECINITTHKKIFEIFNVLHAHMSQSKKNL